VSQIKSLLKQSDLNTKMLFYSKTSLLVFFKVKLVFYQIGSKEILNYFIYHTIFTEENNTKVELFKWKIIKTKQNIIAFKKNNNGLNKYTKVFLKKNILENYKIKI
jgi:hypothetical protein